MFLRARKVQGLLEDMGEPELAHFARRAAARCVAAAGSALDPLLAAFDARRGPAQATFQVLVSHSPSSNSEATVLFSIFLATLRPHCNFPYLCSASHAGQCLVRAATQARHFWDLCPLSPML